MKGLRIVAALALAFVLVLGIGPAAQPAFAQSPAPANPLVRMATTTSTDQSGLLDYLKPFFEKETGYKLQWVAVGTGASLKIGEKGDCDVVLVHARALEDAFMAAGFGLERKDVMYNDFIVLGPASDPAGLASATSASDAFGRIMKTGSTFISRGDNSGTDVKEKDVWKAAGLSPKGAAWYKEAGQGMAQVIVMADQLGAYTLSDRATWLNMKDKFGLKILYQGDKGLFNPYGVITVNPAKWPKTNIEGARAFMNWLTGPRGRELIASYKIGGEQCFYLY
ncbi:MAG TPA: substrate-binding domain-containing protein [Rectinemataceae bacterium]|nr:substrate-binding domain-containing protein [Rectinemataceae bacterium]